MSLSLRTRTPFWYNATRPEARLEPDADLVVRFNASGLPENPAKDAYSAELGIEGRVRVSPNPNPNPNQVQAQITEAGRVIIEKQPEPEVMVRLLVPMLEAFLAEKVATHPCP